ncbi:hypothetical protein K440DRAFT_661399 [Wilcoxina mikolae CBS 423.85]|nr:hypothetical protein K440DRAFT_661399 [Wilcoxina mikolae CBS 423.85]
MSPTSCSLRLPNTTWTEAACRARAEYLIVPAVAQARRNAPGKRQRTDSGYTTPSSPSSPSGPQTPRKSKDEHQPQELVIFPEMELKVELSHPITKKPYVVTGKANWAAGYDTRSTASDGTVLICVEAKQACTFSHAAAQLVTYMAMCRYTRQQEINSNIQGFATDGHHFQFSCIDNAGLVHSSKTLDTKDPKDLKTAYNWIVSQLEVAIFSSPTTTPLKGDRSERMADARNYEDGIFAQRFSRIEPPKIYLSDEPGDQPDLKLKKRSIF